MYDCECTSTLTYPIDEMRIDENLKHTDLRPMVIKIN